MDARATLDAIYEYIKAKDSQDLLADYQDDNETTSPLLGIVEKFEKAFKA